MAENIPEDDDLIIIDPTGDTINYWRNLVEDPKTHTIQSVEQELNLFNETMTSGGKRQKIYKKDTRKRVKGMLDCCPLPLEQVKRCIESFVDNPDFLEIGIDKVDPKKISIFDMDSETWSSAKELQKKDVLKPVQEASFVWEAFDKIRQVNFLNEQQKGFDSSLVERRGSQNQSNPQKEKEVWRRLEFSNTVQSEEPIQELSGKDSAREKEKKRCEEAVQKLKEAEQKKQKLLELKEKREKLKREKEELQRIQKQEEESERQKKIQAEEGERQREKERQQETEQQKYIEDDKIKRKEKLKEEEKRKQEAEKQKLLEKERVKLREDIERIEKEEQAKKKEREREREKEREKEKHQKEKENRHAQEKGKEFQKGTKEYNLKPLSKKNDCQNSGVKKKKSHHRDHDKENKRHNSHIRRRHSSSRSRSDSWSKSRSRSKSKSRNRERSEAISISTISSDSSPSKKKKKKKSSKKSAKRESPKKLDADTEAKLQAEFFKRLQKAEQETPRYYAKTKYRKEGKTHDYVITFAYVPGTEKFEIPEEVKKLSASKDSVDKIPASSVPAIQNKYFRDNKSEKQSSKLSPLQFRDLQKLHTQKQTAKFESKQNNYVKSDHYKDKDSSKYSKKAPDYKYNHNRVPDKFNKDIPHYKGGNHFKNLQRPDYKSFNDKKKYQSYTQRPTGRVGYQKKPSYKKDYDDFDTYKDHDAVPEQQQQGNDPQKAKLLFKRPLIYYSDDDDVAEAPVEKKIKPEIKPKPEVKEQPSRTPYKKNFETPVKGHKDPAVVDKLKNSTLELGEIKSTDSEIIDITSPGQSDKEEEMPLAKVPPSRDIPGLPTKRNGTSKKPEATQNITTASKEPVMPPQMQVTPDLINTIVSSVAQLIMNQTANNMAQFQLPVPTNVKINQQVNFTQPPLGPQMPGKSIMDAFASFANPLNQNVQNRQQFPQAGFANPFFGGFPMPFPNMMNCFPGFNQNNISNPIKQASDEDFNKSNLNNLMAGMNKAATATDQNSSTESRKNSNVAFLNAKKRSLKKIKSKNLSENLSAESIIISEDQTAKDVLTIKEN